MPPLKFSFDQSMLGTLAAMVTVSNLLESVGHHEADKPLKFPAALPATGTVQGGTHGSPTH